MKFECVEVVTDPPLPRSFQAPPQQLPILYSKNYAQKFKHTKGK